MEEMNIDDYKERMDIFFKKIRDLLFVLLITNVVIIAGISLMFLVCNLVGVILNLIIAVILFILLSLTLRNYHFLQYTFLNGANNPSPLLVHVNPAIPTNWDIDRKISFVGCLLLGNIGYICTFNILVIILII